MKRGMTLVELLVATTLSLLLLGSVVVMFGKVGESITDSRAMLEVLIGFAWFRHGSNRTWRA